MAAAREVAVPMPPARATRDHAIAALAKGDGDADWSVIAQVVARNAGL